MKEKCFRLVGPATSTSPYSNATAMKTYNIKDYNEWTFIEENLPDYHRRDDVLYNDIVTRFVNGEDLEEADRYEMEATFRTLDEAEEWLDKDIKRLFIEAFKNAYEGGRVVTITLEEQR